MSIETLDNVYAFSTAFLPQDMIFNQCDPKMTKPKRKKLLDDEEYKRRVSKYCDCLSRRQTVANCGLSFDEILKDASSGKIYLSNSIEEGSDFSSEHYSNQLFIMNRCVYDILKKREKYKSHNKQFV